MDIVVLIKVIGGSPYTQVGRNGSLMWDVVQTDYRGIQSIVVIFLKVRLCAPIVRFTTC